MSTATTTYGPTRFIAPCLTGEENRALVRTYQVAMKAADKMTARLADDAARRQNCKRPMQSTKLIARYKAAVKSHTRTALAARDAIICGNQGLVHKIALKFAGRGVDMDDLAQEGQFGLIEAIARFDLRRQTAFSTYAYEWIFTNIQRAVETDGATIRVPRKRKGAPASGALEACREAASRIATIEPGFADTIPDRESHVPDAEVASIVRGAVALLPDRERRLVSLRWGLSPVERAHTLTEIGTELGITKERVRQLQEQAIRRLATLAEYANISA